MVNAKDSKAVQLKTLLNSPTVGRFAVVNHINSEVAKSRPEAKYPLLSAFLPGNITKWLGSYLKYVFQRRFAFPDYIGSGLTGLYEIAPTGGTDTVRIAIVGDWGTGTSEAEAVADRIVAIEPDFTIHLGDVYYVGAEQEIRENCLGESSEFFSGVTFPRGGQGSFALNGNHEMYANGGPYFRLFLRRLGMEGSQGQVASFFALETDAWRILAIDTGYNSVGVPILSMIPGLKRIPAIGGDCHLEEALMRWLRDVVQPKQRRKATLVLSHHNYFSRFKEHDYTTPARQLAELFDGQEVVWIWGHEHRLGIYDKFGTDGGITAYGRCAGHGGMPVETTLPDPGKKAPLQLFDQRETLLEDGTPVGINGYVHATIEGNDLTLDYRDVHDTQVFLETFSATASGALERRFHDPGVMVKFARP